MRELKFRVWDKLEKEWCSFHPQICSGGVKGAFEFSGSQYQRKNLVILQYTGLKDKHGKEIYEGDIVKTVDGVSKLDVEFAEYTHGEVKWLREGFEVCQARIGATRLSVFSCIGATRLSVFSCDYFTAELEIIGNIFENPELLK